MRKLRIALIWMLMLALPAQSMAAIGMQFCALSQPGQMAGTDSQQMAAHHPGALSMHHLADTGDQTAGANPGSDSVPTDNSLCSLCAFCVGAVALSNVLVSSSPLQAVEPSLARLEQFTGFIAETPERPPRLSLV
jgi:hypothetical protein